jgi:hypothetical protein
MNIDDMFLFNPRQSIRQLQLVHELLALETAHSLGQVVKVFGPEIAETSMKSVKTQKPCFSLT